MTPSRTVQANSSRRSPYGVGRVGQVGGDLGGGEGGARVGQLARQRQLAIAGHGAAHVGEGVAGQPLEVEHLRLGARGVDVHEPCGELGLDRDHGERVAQDVVQVAGEAVALRREPLGSSSRLAASVADNHLLEAEDGEHRGEHAPAAGRPGRDHAGHHVRDQDQRRRAKRERVQATRLVITSITRDRVDGRGGTDLAEQAQSAAASSEQRRRASGPPRAVPGASQSSCIRVAAAQEPRSGREG